MFGYGTQPQEEGADAKFARLKEKYSSALNYADELGARVDALYVEGGNLIARITAPSDDAASQITGAFQGVDSGLAELDLQVTAQPAQVAETQNVQTYTVVGGDSLWRISKKFYGDGGQYMRIFYANRDKISDPDKIFVGQELVIPSGEGSNA
jgi:5'-nucleotidase